MKNKRLISLLLSAALATSSVPMMMATAVSAADDITVDKIIYTGTATEIANTASDGGNYYLHVGSRQETGNTGLGFGFGKLNNEPLPAGTYFISFEGRFAVPGLNNSKFEPRACTRNGLKDGVLGKERWWPTANCECSKHDYGSNPYVTFSTEWTYFEWGFQLDAASDGLWFDLRSYYADYRGRVPFDIDNFSVYTFVESAEGEYILVEAGNGVKTYKLASDPAVSGKRYNKVAVFDTLTFNFEDGTIDKKFNGINGAELSIEEASEYTRIASTDSAPAVTIDVEDVSLTSDKYYILTSDMLVRYGAWNDNYAAETDNQFNVVVSAVIDGEPQELTAAGDSVVYDCDWKAIGDYIITVEESSTLEEIIITTESLGSDYVTAFDVKNEDSFALAAEEKPVSAPVVAEGLLADAEITTNGFVTKIDVEDNGYLKVMRSDASVSNFITFQIPVEGGVKGCDFDGDNIVPNSGTKYYVSFDVKTSDGTVGSIRPIYSAAIYEGKPGVMFPNEYPLGMNGQYIVPTEKCTVKVDGPTMAMNGTEPQNKFFYMTKPNGEWGHFEGYVTPVNKSNSFNFIINRGSQETVPLEFDNIRVWTKSGEVYFNDFNTGSMTIGEDKITTANETVTTEVVVLADYSTLKPDSGESAEIVYDVSALGCSYGNYTFTAELASDQDGAKAQLVYTFKDGTVIEGKRISLNSKYTTLTEKFTVESGILESVKLVTNITTTLKYKNATFTVEVDEDGNKIPNIGIIMVLLLKKSGGAAVKPVKTEFIKDGAFNAEPVIFNSAAPKISTAENAGWYAKDTDARATTISYVNEDGNSFLRITDLDTAQRGIFYNTGVTLEPGTYTFTMDVRVSETEASEAYTAKAWRDFKNSTMQVRANLGDPNGMFSPHFELFKAVDLDSPMNDVGQVYGNCIVMTREWTKYTDTIVIDQPILAVFKIGGGTGGEVDAHGFDIDNVSIIGYVTPKVEEAPVEDAPAVETETPAAEA